MLRTCICLLLVTLLFGCFNSKLSKTSDLPNVPRFEEVSSSDQDFPITVPASFDSRRGFLIVKESAHTNNTRTISLPVVIIKGKQSQNIPNRAPILRLAGGPGISGLNAAAYPGAYPWTSYRDFIVVGQRGTQHAKPALNCPEYLKAREAINSDAKKEAEAAMICRSRYESLGIDLSAYNTMASARDIDALRKTLNIEKFSLYGGSYGTRVALTYAREFPDKVASMVLDSPLPHTVRFDDENPQNFRLALEDIADVCAKDDACANAFPDLIQRFKEKLSTAALTPWKIELQNEEIRSMTDADLVSLLNPSSPSNVVTIPQTMDMIARGDEQALLPLLSNKPRVIAFAWGLRLSVWCSESLPYSSRAKFEPGKNFASLDGAVIAPEICGIWDVPKRPLKEKQATVSSIPTLVIAGQFDHLTPPAWGKKVVSTLKNSHLVTIPYGGHVETNNWQGDGCAMKIADAFFRDEQKFLDNPMYSSKCIEMRSPPAFALN